MVPTKVSHYEITEKIGEEKGEDLYVAVDLKRHNRVLLKLYRGRATAAGVKARQLHNRIAVPHENVNLLSAFDVGEWRNQTYAVCEYAEGKSLATFADEETLEPYDIVDIGIQIAKALVAIHAAGVVHQDIRPGNILITPDREVKLLDFGWTGVTEKLNSGKKGVDVLSGKEPHEPPAEQAGRRSAGSHPRARDYDATDPGERADLYSLGVVLFQMATGSLPHERKSATWTVPKILRKKAPSARALNPNIPAEFSQVLDGLLERDPQSRIGTADELLAKLNNIESKATSTPDPINVMLEEPSTTAVGRKESADGLERRFVNTWFESQNEVQAPPLFVNRFYTLKLNIGSRRNDSSAEFEGADFGGRENVSLLVSLFGEDFEMENRCLLLELSRRGDSSPVETSVKPLSAKKCKLEIVISLAVELEVIQTCEVEVAAIDETAPMTLVAKAAR